MFCVSPGHLGTIQNLIPGCMTIVKLIKQVKNWQSPSRDPWSNCLINSREDDKGQSYYYSGRQKDNSKTICLTRRVCFANHQQAVQRTSRTRQLKVLTPRTHVHGCHSKSVFELVVRKSQHRLCGGEHAEPKDHITRYSRVMMNYSNCEGTVIRRVHHQRNPLQVARHSLLPKDPGLRMRPHHRA